MFIKWLITVCGIFCVGFLINRIFNRIEDKRAKRHPASSVDAFCDRHSYLCNMCVHYKNRDQAGLCITDCNKENTFASFKLRGDLK